MYIKEHIILPIDFHMEMVEYVFKQYIPYPSNVWYIRGRRFPMENRSNLDKYLSKGLARDHPWHPILSLGCLLDIIENYQLRNSRIPEYFKSNPLLDTSEAVYQVERALSVSDIITVYINNINEHDLRTLTNYFEIILDEALGPVIDKYPDSILTLDMETSQYRLTVGSGIKEHRFDEALTAKKYAGANDVYV